TPTGDVPDEAEHCAPGGDATYADVVTAGSCANESTITRTWSLTDACGNNTELVQTISVVDTTAPTFTVPADVTIECDQDATDLTLTGDVTDEADNCATGLDATYSDVVTAGSCANESTITRTWSLTDACGNNTELVQTISVVDTTAPTFTVPADVTIECDQDATDLTLTGDVTDEADNCATGLDATYSDVVTAGNCANEATTTRTWSVTDASGNNTELVQIISVVDTTAPVVPQAPADEAYQCVDDVPAAGNLTAVDSCGGDITVTGVDSINDTDPCNVIITRTWTFTDACNNSDSVSQTITVSDTTAPELVTTLQTELTVSCANIPDAPEPQFQDNCNQTVTIVFNETSTFDGTAQDYQIIREWSATDSCGNETVVMQTVNVTTETTIETVSESVCNDGGIIDLYEYLDSNMDTSGTWVVESGNVSLNDD